MLLLLRRCILILSGVLGVSAVRFGTELMLVVLGMWIVAVARIVVYHSEEFLAGQLRGWGSAAVGALSIWVPWLLVVGAIVTRVYCGLIVSATRRSILQLMCLERWLLISFFIPLHPWLGLWLTRRDLRIVLLDAWIWEAVRKSYFAADTLFTRAFVIHTDINIWWRIPGHG